jgi:hypothetical protein
MAYYTNLFSPRTYEAFGKSDRTTSGFRMSQHTGGQRIKPGDKFICYMTKLSRWIGVLEVLSECFIDDEPIFYSEDDPFVVRFKVKPLVWLPKEKCVPVHESHVWETLSFTRELPLKNTGWTGIVRRSLNRIPEEDGVFFERLLTDQNHGSESYPVDDVKFRKLASARIRRADKVVTVSVPENEADEIEDSTSTSEPIRTSHHIQALLSRCGERMGLKIWLPRNDRASVQQEWSPESDDHLLDTLPLNYDDTTLRTIEQIDVLWLKGRSIIRAFEVEHTTAVYSGILRMADLLALQPNMDIKLHIVAPESRKQKVFDEILRPVFSFLERAPLSESCTYLSYDSVEELMQLEHIGHISDSVLDEYVEEAE